MEELNIGKKLKERRLERGLSVRKAAALAEITPSMLSQMENGQANPSINTLRAVARVLELPLYELFRSEESAEIVVHPHQRRVIADGGENGVRYELLTRDNRGSIEFCLMVIAAGGSSCAAPESHSGEETAYVLGGEGTLEADGLEYRLAAGDSLRIAPMAKHIWRNTGGEELRVIFAVTPPAF